MPTIALFDTSFVREYMRGGLVVSLLSVWVLVALFYYLNHYTRRHYFTIWTAAWLFYALWLTQGITVPDTSPGSLVSVLRQWCVGTSAVFLLWGSFCFMEIPARQNLFGFFMAFLLVWSYASPMLLSDRLLIQLPVFILIGLASMFAGVSFYRLRKRYEFVACGMLFLGFFLWGVYLATYPFTEGHSTLTTVAFLVSAVLQLFIAVSMIVLVLEEVRYSNKEMSLQIQSVKSEKEALQLKILSTEEQCRTLFDQARLKENLQTAYDELRQTQRSVVEQERLRALGQMASGIAHDVNNAVSPILTFSELLLQKDDGLTEHTRKYLGHIRTAAEDIAQIVARMAQFYRRRGEPELARMVNPNHVVEEVIELTRPRWQDIPQGQGVVIQMKKDFGPSVPELYCDETELREALTNLVLNSVEALPEGGEITISSRGICSRTGAGSDGTPTHLVLEVRDNGIGMDEKTRRRCLEPFFSTKRDCGGSGLGLAMVYGMMERQDGTIQIESAPDKGTKVTLIFPLRRPAKAKVPPPTAPPPTLSACRVLCIDDEPLLRELLKEALEYAHYTVDVADGGQVGVETFQAARRRGEPFDVVITDLGMPHLDGRQVAERVKAESPKTPVIMLTGWREMLSEQEEASSKVDAVLGKPPRLSELTETLARVTAVKNS
jgi:signal transduction histidine kinase/ActR/RegA family two-component response regulator